MFKLTKKIPRPLVESFLRWLTNLLILFYRIKFKQLIIRKGTSDHYVFRDIFLFKEFKLPVKIIPKLIIDTGAYTGLSSLYYSSKYPKSKIISVEPEISNFKILSKNTELNLNIKRIKAGIWSKNTKLKIVDSNSAKWAFTVNETYNDDADGIQAITIDQILFDSGFEQIDILKIDIEGSEKEIFSNNSEKWLSKVNILVLELHDRLVPGCSNAVYNSLFMDEWQEYKKGEKVILINKKYLESLT